AYGSQRGRCVARQKTGRRENIMTKIQVLPHESLCPGGVEFEAPEGESLCDALLRNGIEIEHACEKSCACTTCHVIVREGLASLDDAEEKEEDMLDMAWGLTP